jgi:Sialic acid synthase
MKIIAEIGSNIKSYEDCVNSIKYARKAGANIVKFQLLSEFDLYGEGSKDYRPFRLEWLAPLHQVAVDNEIEFMCTGFSVDGYKAINPFVERHKVASAEITAMDLLETVASFKKPVLLSTGGASVEQIHDAICALDDCPITLMACVPKYPAKVMSPFYIKFLKDAFEGLIHISFGYSDHTTDCISWPDFYAKYGASIIEKHANFLDYTDTPDAPHSLNFEEFNFMTRTFKGEFS